MERWGGKVAVVTGASSGIGLSTAKQLVHHGLIVIGLARRFNKMEARRVREYACKCLQKLFVQAQGIGKVEAANAKEEMRDVEGPGEFHAKECDITNEQNVIEAFSWIKETFESLDILVNNAASLIFNSIEDCSTEDIQKIFKLNVYGIVYCTKQAIPVMKENQNEGHIININSLAGHKVDPFPVPLNVYPASKFAVTALSETLRNELSDSKIRVTSVSPGPVNTAILDYCKEKNSMFKNIPSLKPEDVSNSIMHALSAPPNVEINEIILTPRFV